MKKTAMLVLALLLAIPAVALGPTDSVSAQALTQLRGKIYSIPSDLSRLTLEAESGGLYSVELSQLPARVRQDLHVGDSVTMVGVAQANNNFVVHQVYRADGAPAAAGSATDQLHGTVYSIPADLSRFTLEADGGVLYSVELSQLGERARRSLRVGDRVTLVGVAQPNNNFVAYRVVAGGHAPQATANHLQGTVTSRTASHVWLRTDDGRLHSVDVSNLPARSQHRLDVNDRVTVEGTLGRNNTFVAFQVLGTGDPMPSASPAYAPQSRQDCRKGGWRNYGFGDQRSCIDWVNRN